MLFILITVATIAIIFGITNWLLGNQRVRNYGNRYVLITGCNSGFGNLLAKQLDAIGFNVFAGCHSDNGIDELDAVTSDRLVTFKLDVTEANSVNDAVEFVKARIPAGHGLWALVNNAGTAGPLGPVDWLGKQDYLQPLAVNLLGLIDVTRSFLPLLREGQGRVINVSSILTKLAVGPSPYIVSKYAVEGFSDYLRLELFRQGVSVIVIQPGFYRTNLLPLDKMVARFRSSFAQASFQVQTFYGKEYLEKAIHRCHRIHSMTSESLSEVTEAYVKAVTSRYPRARYIVGRDANFVCYAVWKLPQWIKDFILTCNSIQPEGLNKTPRVQRNYTETRSDKAYLLGQTVTEKVQLSEDSVRA